jgi:hypothetical protein
MSEPIGDRRRREAQALAEETDRRIMENLPMASPDTGPPTGHVAVLGGRGMRQVVLTFTYPADEDPPEQLAMLETARADGSRVYLALTSQVHQRQTRELFLRVTGVKRGAGLIREEAHVSFYAIVDDPFSGHR